MRDLISWHPPPNNNDACGDYTDYEFMSSRLMINPRPAKQLHYMTVQPDCLN